MSNEKDYYTLPLRKHKLGPTVQLYPDTHGESEDFSIVDLEDFNIPDLYVHNVDDNGNPIKVKYQRNVPVVAVVKLPGTEHSYVLSEFKNNESVPNNGAPRYATSPRIATINKKHIGTRGTRSPRRSDTRSASSSIILDPLASMVNKDIKGHDSDEIYYLSGNANIPNVDLASRLVQNGPVLLSLENGDIKVTKLNEGVTDQITSSLKSLGDKLNNILSDTGNQINNLLTPENNQESLIDSFLNILGLNNQ